MNIRINKKKHTIKPASELTISEYIEFFEKFKPETKSIGVMVNYLTVTLKLDYLTIANLGIDKNTARRFFAYIGEIQEASKIEVSDQFYYKRTGKVFYQKSMNWRTAGVMQLIEERNETNQTKLAVYLLAVYISQDYDVEKISRIYEELQDYRAIDVLSFVIFFFKKLYNGKKQKTNFFRRLLSRRNTNTLN
jgi:hypothetical protein